MFQAPDSLQIQSWNRFSTGYASSDGGCGLPRTALQDYLKVRGNPSIAMVEHLAQKMGIKPSVLLTDKSLEEFFALLLDAFPEVSETDEMRKLRFIELAAEMEQFLSDEP